MNSTEQLARHLREFYFGGNWTASNLRDALADVTFQQATTTVDDFHDIATLVCHINYYVRAVLEVLRGRPLDARDELSFDHPPIQTQSDWSQRLSDVWDDVESLATLIEQLPDAALWDCLAEEKYGNRYRNFLGIIEHNHYHLGQILMIKKTLWRSGGSAS